VQVIDTPRAIGADSERLRTAISSKLFVVLADLVIITGGVSLAHAVSPAGSDAVVSTIVLVTAWAVWLNRARLYSIRFITRRSEEIRRIVNAGLLALATTALVGFLLRWQVSRLWLMVAVGLATVALLVERELIRQSFNRRRCNGTMRRSVVIVGDNNEARQLGEMFAGDKQLGYEVREVVPTSHRPDRRTLLADVFSSIGRTGATGAVVAATAIPPDHMNRLVRDLLDAGVHVELSSTLADIEPHRLTVRPLGRYPVVYVEPISRHGWRAAAKRTFDVVVSATTLILASPLLVFIALAIKFDSAGPVLFKQERLGRHGALFEVLKFRTMVQDAEVLKADLARSNEAAGPLFKMKFDPRVTSVGRILRMTSLDEIPQLWNVIIGEMSLVGPRPALPAEAQAWDEDLFGRLRVRPGLTGMWQVSGRSGTTFEEYTRLDLFYVDNWSLVVDLSILMRTVPAVLGSDGAY
jgi:exopolysaccharide biosynthesis polyprenyl glycosylphosphotransferase